MCPSVPGNHHDTQYPHQRFTPRSLVAVLRLLPRYIFLIVLSPLVWSSKDLPDVTQKGVERELAGRKACARPTLVVGDEQ